MTYYNTEIHDKVSLGMFAIKIIMLINLIFMSRLFINSGEKPEIGMDIVAQFKKFQSFTVNDVYFVPA